MKQVSLAINQRENRLTRFLTVNLLSAALLALSLGAALWLQPASAQTSRTCAWLGITTHWYSPTNWSCTGTPPFHLGPPLYTANFQDNVIIDLSLGITPILPGSSNLAASLTTQNSGELVIEPNGEDAPGKPLGVIKGPITFEGATTTVTGGRLQVDGNISSNGTVNIENVLLDVRGEATTQNKFSILAGGKLSLGGGTHNGDFDVASGGKLTFSGSDKIITGDITGAGDVNLGRSSTTVGSGRFEVEGLTIIEGDVIFDLGIPHILDIETLDLTSFCCGIVEVIVMPDVEMRPIDIFNVSGDASLELLNNSLSSQIQQLNLPSSTTSLTISRTQTLILGDGFKTTGDVVDDGVNIDGADLVINAPVRLEGPMIVNGSGAEVELNGPFTLSPLGGEMIVNGGTVMFNDTVDSYSFLSIGGGAATFNYPVTNHAADVEDVADARIEVNDGNVTFNDAFENNGQVVVEGNSIVTVDGVYTQMSGQTLLNNSFLWNFSHPIDIQGGSLSGTGKIQGDVINAAEVSPGLSPGTLTILGDYTQTSSGVLNIEIEGTTPGTEFDELSVSGDVTLDGALNVTFANGFQPNATDSFKVMTYFSHTGNFATVNNANADLTDTGLVLFVTETSGSNSIYLPIIISLE